jgi:hypothetical protein
MAAFSRLATRMSDPQYQSFLGSLVTERARRRGFTVP